MIDLDEYDSLFQKMEDLFQGLTSVVSEKTVVDDKKDVEENHVAATSRRDLYSSSIALADERDDSDADFDFLKETEDKIAAELLELTDLMHSASQDSRSSREMPEHKGTDDKSRRIGRIQTDSGELDRAIWKQLEEFRVSGRSTRADKKKVEQKKKQLDKLQKISGSQDDHDICQSNSQLDSLETSKHDALHAMAKNHCGTGACNHLEEENVELTICHDDFGVEIDGLAQVVLERELKETYPLEFEGRSPAPPKSALSFLSRNPSITSSSSEESSLVWLEETVML